MYTIHAILKHTMQKNTYKGGSLNFIMYPTNEGTLVAACRELCLVEEGKDKEMLRYKIMGRAKSYIANVCKNKLGEHLLNQDLPKEIVKEFDAYRMKKINENFQKWSEKIKELMASKSVTLC